MKRRFLMSIPMLFGALFFTYFFTAINVNAALVSPPFDDKIYKPGQQASGSFTIFFTDEDPEVLYLSLAKMNIDDITGAKSAEYVSESEDALANWVTLDRITVNRPPGVTFTEGDNGVKVNYTIDIPADAKPGGNYAVVIISNIPRDPALQGSAAQIDTGLGVGSDITYQIISEIEGELVDNVGLECFEVVQYNQQDGKCGDGQWLFSSLPVGFDVLFQNNGTSHVIPRGFVEVFQGGDKVATVSLNSGQIRVFPGKSRLYENVWSNEGIETAESETQIREMQESLPETFIEHVLYQITHFRIGMYTAKLGGFAGNQPAFAGEITFWIIPWHLILTVIVLILVIYFGWRVKRKFSGTEYVAKGSGKYKKATKGK